MRQSNKYNILIFLLFLLIISYLVINTGVISDDFDVIFEIKDKNFKDILLPTPKTNAYFIDVPMEHFTHYIWYYFFHIDNHLTVNIIKIFYIFLSFYLMAKFFNIYLDKQDSLLASFLFIFFPSHDSTVYAFMIQYLTLSFAFYLYAFYLAYHNKLVLAFLLSLIASFISYGSTSIAVALFILFLLNKNFKKGMILLIPNIIYSLYFISVNIIMRIGHPRIIERLTPSSFIKQYILQILSFVDSLLGPSMWMKIYYAFSHLSIMSLIIGIILIIINYRMSQVTERRYDSKLIISFIVLLFLSFLVYAFTGRYPQLAFNLGNRVTIFGSLLFTYLIILLPASRKIKTLYLALIIFTILGISGHWKEWNLNQQMVIANIKNNQDLKEYQDNKIIYVSGNQYSKYGPISHIEFLSEDWVVNSVFKLALGKNISAATINKRHKFIDGYLIDTKYNRKKIVKDYMNIYDSQKNIFFKLKIEMINNYIDSLPSDNRHWIQIINIRFIKNIVNKLMPRLKYAL